MNVKLAVNPPQYHGGGDCLSGTRTEGTLLAEPVLRVSPKSRFLLELEAKQAFQAKRHNPFLKSVK